MQCNAMQCNAIQYNTIQYDTIQTCVCMTNKFPFFVHCLGFFHPFFPGNQGIPHNVTNIFGMLVREAISSTRLTVLA